MRMKASALGSSRFVSKEWRARLSLREVTHSGLLLSRAQIVPPSDHRANANSRSRIRGVLSRVWTVWHSQPAYVKFESPSTQMPTLRCDKVASRYQIVASSLPTLIACHWLVRRLAEKISQIRRASTSVSSSFNRW